jgi:nitrogenase molybdenum-iron protein NifN
MAVREFRTQYPRFDATPVVAVSTPDFAGCLESGFAAAVKALTEDLVREASAAGTQLGRRPRLVNVLVGSALTPGDLEHLKDLIEAFDLRPLVLPDLSDALDGHLTGEDFSPLTIGGTPVGELSTLGDARAILVVGESMVAAADALHGRTGVPDHRFAHLMGLDAVDALVATLAEIAGRPVPVRLERLERLERQRAQLQDAMLDCHFALGMARLAIAADADLLAAFSQLLAGVGAETVAAVAPASKQGSREVPFILLSLGALQENRGSILGPEFGFLCLAPRRGLDPCYRGCGSPPPAGGAGSRG